MTTTGTDELIVYKAKGIILGQYFPSTKFRKGILVTTSGDKFPCNLSSGKIASLLKTNPSFLEQPLIWSCCPRQIHASDEGEASPPAPRPGLKFQAIHLHLNPALMKKVGKRVDYFTISGEVSEVVDRTVSVIIRRNITPPPKETHWWQWQPFTLNLVGQLPKKDVVGMFWDFYCFRSGDRLLIQDVSLRGIPPQQWQFSSFEELNWRINNRTQFDPQKSSQPTTKTQPDTQKSSQPTNPTTPTITTGDDMAITGKVRADDRD